MPFANNVDLIGYQDLGGRPGFKLAMQEIEGRFILYVGSLWDPGWSIVDVTNPEAPEYLRWIAGPSSTSTVQVQVAEGLMVTALSHRASDWLTGPQVGEPSEGFLVWDVNEADNPRVLGRWKSHARGTHRNFYAGGKIVHVSTTLPGFEGHLYGAIDISDPSSPRLLGKWWWPGQNQGEGEALTDAERKAESGRGSYWEGGAPFPAHSLHAPYVTGDRAYCSWMRSGLVILDITSIETPTLVSRLPFYPPLGSSISVHSAVPLTGRALLVVNSEALNESCKEPVNFAGIVDISDEADPMLIALFPQPRAPTGYGAPNFCAKGGRFGPHNQHQYQAQMCLLNEPNLVFLTYFNAGLQIYDVREPRDPYISGFYIPDDPTDRYGPLPKSLVTQVEDVLVDRRGNIFITEKNSGLYCLRFGGL